jgi:hypothetical protein
MNNTFNIHRFGALVRQGVMHDYKMYLISIVGFSGILFIIFFVTQFNFGISIIDPRSLVIIYILTFIGAGLLYTGSAFGGFRSKEKSISYLLIPESRSEKFLCEYVSRIIIFLVAFPVLFWLVYNLEGVIFGVLHPAFTFKYQEFFFVPKYIIQPDKVNPYPLIYSAAFFVLTIPFTGAAIFNKHPLIKTLFSVSIIFFFHLILIYVFVEVLKFKHYNISDEAQIYLLPTSAEKAITFFTITLFIANILLTLIAYFKLKEKEV